MGAAARIIEPTLAEIVALNGRRPSGGRSRGRSAGIDTALPFGPPTIVSSKTSLAWWRSDQRVIPNTGDATKVAAWVDMLGGYAAQQGTTAAQPTYTPVDAAVNNRPSLSGDGVQTYLENNLGVAALLAGNDKPFAAYILIRPASVTADGVFLGLSSTTVTGSRFHLTHVSSATAWRSARTDDAAASASQSGGTPVINTNYLVRVFFSGAAITVIANGVTVINNLALDVGTITLDRLTFFAQRQATGAAISLLGGKICEVYLANGQPSAVEDTRIGTYFTGLYGAPVA